MKYITITIALPEGIETPDVDYTVEEAPPLPEEPPLPEPPPEPAMEPWKCPEHGTSRVAPSKYGGFYCRWKYEDGNWCKKHSPIPQR